jgi:hypothetical protein
MIYAAAEAAARRLGSVALPDVELPARPDVEPQTADISPRRDLGSRAERHALCTDRGGRSS